MSIKSASGYGDLAGSPLGRIGYVNEIMMYVLERDFLPEITNGDVDEDIIRCNQKVQLMTQPKVGPWRTWHANQKIIPNQITPNATCLEICNAAYSSIKLDKGTIHFMCDRMSAWEEAFLDSVYESYVAMQRSWVLAAMICEASPQNSGSFAGKHGNIDLGSPGNPVVVTPENIPLRITELATVLNDQDTRQWRDGEMFVVMPIAFRQVLSMSNYANATWTGTCKPCSFGIDGMWNTQIGGFNVIETTHAPSVLERDGKLCYYVIAGHPSAFAYISNIIEGRVVEPTDSFSVEYQMLAVWGGKMLFPEALAVAYWTFQVA